MPGLQPAVPYNRTLLEGVKPRGVVFVHPFPHQCLSSLPSSIPLCSHSAFFTYP